MIILTIFILYLILPKAKESIIKAEIQKANYCQIDADCIDAGGKCPFGCYNYVNKDRVLEISKKIETYTSKCVYGCISCPTAKCSNNKCVASCN
ncbi:MAG: hypothetical protein UT48_C0001G0017 [Parcubacteria group bacterium GW2011_GWE2_39_37]|uniref:Uncharacterized protein n=1 Tax=Candidatus Falkowbacteria bacterium GW2011_GWF2_39_8 TaxID=1618642 RepID=A0A0G0Q7C7_9BACT|nr:MAG: hypothetical protein UT48_C0001G0017 [Parcubacteria group bacterium GW2011_GWE2_39_37]KKR33216.1 MAG: hypothetical protein UT64_C0012G0008 [Candidatus Falkowbacteria bacterium GW2011_GWF2_39_8]